MFAASGSRLQYFQQIISFQSQKFDEMQCKLDSTENPRSFEKYPTPPLPTGRLVTVHINRFGSTYWRTWSISTVCLIPPTENYGQYQWSVQSTVPNFFFDINHHDTDRFIQKKNLSTVDIDSRSGHTIKKSVDIDFAYQYFTMSTDQKNCLSHSLLFTVTNF